MRKDRNLPIHISGYVTGSQRDQIPW